MNSFPLFFQDIKFKTETLEEAQVSWTQTFTETDGLRVVWTEGGLRARPSYSPVLHPIAKTYKITGLEKNKGYKITIERGSLISSTTDKDALKEHANYQWTIVGHRNLLAGLVSRIRGLEGVYSGRVTY